MGNEIVRLKPVVDHFVQLNLHTGIELSAASNGVGSLDVKGTEDSDGSSKGEEFHLVVSGW